MQLENGRPVRIRLSQFCEVIGEDRGSVLAIISRGYAPFNKEMPEGSPTSRQRTYDGADLVAWLLFSRLREGGMEARMAGEAVRLSKVCEIAVTERGCVSDLHLYLWRVENEAKEQLRRIVGTKADAASLLSAEERVLSLTVVPVDPCYLSAQAGLYRAGFAMEGRNIFSLPSTDAGTSARVAEKQRNDAA